MKYMDWYKTEETLYTNDGNKIKVLCLDSQDNDEILDEWAMHFRENYRSLDDLDFDRHGIGKTREEFL